ncbi:tRNAHis guanylyltransferase [Serendipita vermifera]|nr:tRNAHis guanylyltransferase [Serendipita vermifera]
MANSKYTYVRSFELPDNILPGTYMVVRLDGHGFHRFSADHGFEKPNDERGLRLMDAAAIHVMKAYPQVALAFGESDEFSFLLRRSCDLYSRRSSKISSLFASLFSAAYTRAWTTFFPDTPLQYPPSFDGRVVAYPSSTEVRDYFAWRQADTHVNNLYNTTFWALVLKRELTTQAAHEALKGTTSSQKQEILFSRFGINYNTLPSRYRKGSVLYRKESIVEDPLIDAAEDHTDSSPAAARPTAAQSSRMNSGSRRSKKQIVVEHCDLIGPQFWETNGSIL